MERDRTQIGLTVEGVGRIAALEELGWFNDAQDAARFCLAYAVKAKVPEGIPPKTETRWGVANFDSSGEIRTILAAVYPDCKMPVRLIEYLIDEGLRMVSDRLSSGDIGPSELME